MSKAEVEMYVNGLDDAIIILGYHITPAEFDKDILIIYRKAMKYFNGKLNIGDITKEDYYYALHLLNKSATKYLSK